MSIRQRRALLSAVVSVCAVLVFGCLDNGLDTALSEDLVPKAPTNVSATAESQTSISVSWSSLTGIKGYRVYRSASVKWTDSTLVGSSTSSSYVDKDLLSNKTYYYKVSACNGSGESSTSLSVKATTKLGTPTNVTADATSTSSIRVSWSLVNGADGYYVYRSSTGNTGSYTKVGSPASPPYTDNGLSSNTTYYYQVSAYNNAAGEESLRSEYFSVRIDLNAPIMNVNPVSSSSNIIVSWSSVSGAIRYHVYRATSASGNYSQIGTASSTSYTDNNVTAGQTYYYKVSAYNGNMESSLSSNYATATLGLYAPSSVNALVVASTNSGSNSIIVVWTPVSGVTGYKVYRSTSSNGSYSSVGSTASASYTDNNVSSGTTYYYKVSSTTTSGAESSQSSATASATVLNAPEWVSATYSSSSVTLEWGSVSGATGYRVYRSTSNSGAYNQLTESYYTSYSDISVSSGRTYYYKISAYKGNTESMSSAVSVVAE